MGKVTGTTLTVAKEISTEHVSTITSFFRRKGAYDSLPDYCNSKDLYSHLIRTLIKPDLVLRGRLTYLLTVKPTFANIFGALHGGAIAAVAEMVSIACARTVVAEDKDIFLGELGITYLSSAPINWVIPRRVVDLLFGWRKHSSEAEVIVNCSVVRSGRNLTVVAMEFKLKKTGQLAYTARTTFYNTPVAKL
uniref:Thioesterase domain-containing protein n=1 Tax=Fagus sylvatica TaxID=28930 RepID=A0A2N9GV27_FAGSY